MATKILKHFWDGGSGFNDVEILIGYCKEEPIEVLKSIMKTHCIHSYKEIFCKPIEKYPANCSGLVIKEYDSRKQEEHGMVITKSIKDYGNEIKDFEWSEFNLELFEKSADKVKAYSESFGDGNACKEIYFKIYEDFKDILDELKN